MQVEGAINIPLVQDVLAVRLAGFHWKRDGYVKSSSTLPDGLMNRYASDAAALQRQFGTGTTMVNGDIISRDGRVLVDNGVIINADTGLPVEPRNYNRQDVTELRGAIRFTPGDDFENTTLFTYHTDANSGTTTGGYLVARDAGVPVGIEDQLGTGTYTGYRSSASLRGRNHSYAIINTTTYDFADSLTLKNIFGYINAKGYVLNPSDSDGGPGRIIDGYSFRTKSKTQQYTNELQLQGTLLDDRLDFTVGGLMDLIRQPRDPNGLSPVSASSVVNAALVDPGRPNAQPFLERFLSSNIDSYSLYGAGTFSITDQLSASFGYRHIWDKVDALQASALNASHEVPHVFQDADPDIAGFQQTRRLKASFQGDVYNFGLDYQLMPDVLVYAGYRHGWKRGGFNSSAFGTFSPGFGPEKIDSYSLGAKTSFDVGSTRVRFNVEGYYDSYKGFQASYLLFASGSLLTLTTNIPKVRYTGFDADLAVSFTDFLDLSVNYAYIDAKITDFPDTTTAGPNPGLEGNEITYVSKHQLQASARFHGEVENVGEWVIRPSVSYRSKFYTTLFNRSLPASQRAVFGPFNNLALGGATVPGVTLVDLRAELNGIAGSNFNLAVGATNLLDKYYMIGNSGTLSFGHQGNAIGAPRMVYGEVTYRF